MIGKLEDIYKRKHNANKMLNLKCIRIVGYIQLRDGKTNHTVF